ncbi:MAG: prepilin-type N-terminal cleavage/methylation domain-containing protein [Thermoanaerobaculia bacterium]
MTSANRTKNAGFSLIETLVALMLIGMALFFTMSLLAQEPWVLRRLRAHGEALEVLDTVHEAIRAGRSLAPGSARLDWQRLYDPPRTLDTATNLVIFSEVETLSPRGLYQVTLRARYSVGNQSFDRVLTTMIWRP